MLIMLPFDSILILVFTMDTAPRYDYLILRILNSSPIIINKELLVMIFDFFVNVEYFVIVRF